MKKISIVLLSAAVLFLAGCKKNDDKASPAGDLMTFTGRIDNGGAKTQIDGNLNMKWMENDKININGEDFDSEIEGDGTTAVFTGTLPEAGTYKACYPETLYNKNTDTYSLPAEQTRKGENGENLSLVNPMYTESTTTDLQFHNICAMVKLMVTGSGTVKEIVVSTSDANKYLSGEFSVIDKVATIAAGSSSVTLNCGTDGVVLDAIDAKPFYIALPENEYTNLTFTFKNGDNSVVTTCSMNLKAGQIRTKEIVCDFSGSTKFTAHIGNSKTEINGNLMKWSEGDKININGVEFTAELEGDGETAVFTSTGGAVTPIYKALYPSSYASLSGDNVVYTLPATQTHNENNLSEVNPMYAESTTTDLQFHNICAMLKLVVKGTGTVNLIRVQAATALYGPFTVETDGDHYYASITTGSSSGATITLNCVDEDNNGVALDEDTAHEFYIALPENNYNSLQVLFNSSDVVGFSGAMNLTAGQMRTKEITVNL